MVEMECEGSTKKRKRCASPGTAGNTSSPSAPHEVFLSFSGDDTRKSFTDYLYHDLDQVGIRTFRDNEGIPIGEDIDGILKAIEESKISIPIFSSNYASSEWCLRELARMVECQKTMGQKIFPIFYDVEPSEVEDQTGSYKEAFRQHERDFGENTVQGWKEALRDVVKLKGFVLKDETNGHQGELVKKVVSKVLLELKKNYVGVTDNLVGIDNHVKEMTRLLNVDSNDVRIVGILGMGGIGKTTIAKVIYNQLLRHFECCCFLADVRKASQQYKGLVKLKNELISKIQKHGISSKITNIDEGTHAIKDMVSKKKVLIVLDDVSEKSQIDMLAGNHNWFCSGSRIIVTTRNKEVLVRLEVDETYEPPLMKFDHSRQLFSKHAFRMDFPPEDFDFLSKEIVSTADGLPLALESIGLFLFEKKKVVWEETLMQLKTRPNEEVQIRLKISYEALKDDQKQIFLDIACLFIGMEERIAFYMWDDCDLYPNIGIDALVRRSLVTIGDGNKLEMHNQLRDLGREIVREENIDQPGKRSRVWRHKDALEILENQKGTENVKALCLDLDRESHNHCFTNEEFGQLPNLRYLRVVYGDLAGDFKLLSNLRWLDWRRCSGNFMETTFPLNNLVILDLSRSKITYDCRVWSQIKMAKKLKVLDLSYCDLLERTPDFSTFATLERLTLQGCRSLVEIHPSIGNLINLRVLDISHSGIMELPDTIGNSKRLERLTLQGCRRLDRIHPSIGNLINLRVLDISYSAIVELLDTIGNLERKMPQLVLLFNR